MDVLFYRTEKQQQQQTQDNFLIVCLFLLLQNKNIELNFNNTWPRHNTGTGFAMHMYAIF